MYLIRVILLKWVIGLSSGNGDDDYYSDLRDQIFVAPRQDGYSQQEPQEYGGIEEYGVSLRTPKCMFAPN